MARRWLLVVLVLAACAPAVAGDGSNPAGAAPLAELYANDAVLSYDLTDDRMVLAYDDEAGGFQADTTGNVLVPRANPSLAGISMSRDHGKTWTLVGPIAAAGAGCGDARCAVAIAGSGSLEPMETGDQTFWTGLAASDASSGAPDSIAWSSSADGVHWSPARIASWTAGDAPGEPSIGRAGNTSVIAFTDTSQGQLLLLPFEGAAPQPGPPYLLPIDRDDEGVAKAHPIVRLVSGYLGYVAYMLPRDEQGTSFDLRVAVIERKLTPQGLTPWEGLLVFHLDDVTIDPTRQGALGRTWRDAEPIGLALGHGPKLHLVYRQLSSTTGRSQVFAAECDATETDACAVESNGTNSTSWTVTALDDLLPPTTSTAPVGGEYRPTVAADPFSGAVAFTWLQEAQPGSTELTLVGTSSSASAGLELGAPQDLTGGHPWTPCPTAGLVGAATHSYGTHDAMAVLPLGAEDSSATVVTGYTSSSLGCQSLGQLTFDQHVEVTPW